MIRFLFLFLILCPGLVSAQNEQPLNSKHKAWLTLTEQNEIYSYYMEGDTVIGSQPCMKIMRRRLFPDTTRPSYQCALMEEDGKMWRILSGETAASLLYDFKAEVDNRLSINRNTLYTVAHVDSVTVNGQRLRRLFINNDDGELADIWVEGVGGRNLFCGGWPDTNYVLSCLVDGNEVFSQHDFTRTEDDPPYHSMLTVGKRWNQHYSDWVNPTGSYDFYYEIKGDTLISGVRHYKLFSHNIDNRGEEKLLAFLIETDMRVYYFLKDYRSYSDLLYDFGAQAGTKLAFRIGSINNPPDALCMDCDKISKEGAPLRRLWMSYKTLPGGSHSEWNPVRHPLDCWVEGIGSSTDFFNSHYWVPQKNTRLESCTLNGAPLFTYDDFGIPETSAPAWPEIPYHPMLADGKTWLYTYSYGYSDPDTYELHVTKYDVTYTLRGDTVIDGRDYMKMYEEYEGKCGYHSAWREDGRKIYVAYPNRKDSLCYDFGLPYLGQAPYSYRNALYYDIFLVNKEVIQMGGLYHTRYQFISDGFYEQSFWVDGVGCENGLVYPHHERAGMSPYWFFASCTMPDGTTVTPFDMYGKAVDDYSVITEEAVPLHHADEHHFYDLQGRRVSGTPQRGIYIRDGRKYVVR